MCPFLGWFKAEGEVDDSLSSLINEQNSAFSGEKGADLGETKDPREIVALVIKSLLGLVGTLFLGYTIFAGYMIMTSGGDEEKIKKGKDTLKTAVIGVLITLSAYAITLIVARIVMAEDPSGLRVETRPETRRFYDPTR